MKFGLRDFLRVCSSKMSSQKKCTLVPDCVRGMKQLEREKFLHITTLPVLKLPTNKVSKIQPLCKAYILKLEKFKAVQNLGDEDKPFEKCIYLNPDKVTSWVDIPEEHRQKFNQHEVTESNFGGKEKRLTYNNFKYSDIFNAVLPEGSESVSGFTQIGHIIHLNLRDHLLEYKHLIGQVLIDKITVCRTVVNKTAIINETFRNFNMEVVAGDEDFIVTAKENQCNFQFDFSKVYWNSRLGMEHERIVNSVVPGDVLFDVFCGVGPFAVPIAKKKCRVFANDLNPESFKWLNKNAVLNKVKMSFFKSYNMDGKDFICSTFKEFLIDLCIGKEKVDPEAKIHVTMNLPAIAVEFLKHFNGLMDDATLYDRFNINIIVYLYCFVVGDDPVETAKQMAIDNIGYDITPFILNVFDVRNVAPSKQMMKVTFKLTKEVLFASDSEKDLEPPSKRQCVESVSENRF